MVVFITSQQQKAICYYKKLFFQISKIIARVLHGPVLGSFCCLIYINDQTKAYQFADDPNILESNASPIDLATKWNHDLKNTLNSSQQTNSSPNFVKPNSSFSDHAEKN